MMCRNRRRHSTIKTIRGVLRPAFQLAVDDDILHKNPFNFELVGVVVNDSVRREALTRDQMRKFLKFVHDDNCYCKYYEAFYILFHTGMCISEFCGLTISDLDMENRFKHAVTRYNDIYRIQMPTITPHVCRHTYCSNQAKAGMNPKTLQYLMGHSDIGVTLNTYTHLGLEDAAAEMARMEAVEAARREQEKLSGESGQIVLTQKMFKTV